MKFYFIRHAPTESNVTGKMVKDYDKCPIIPTDPEGWEELIGKHIPEEARNYILCSPTLRCKQTCELVFKRKPLECMNEFAEFDCSGLGKKKFWEMTQTEFEKLVPLRSEDMAKRADEIFNQLANHLEQAGIEHCAVVSHGMFIRYLYHFVTGNKDISAYEVINSKGFNFANLDLMVYDTNTKEVEVHHYKNPVNHTKI